MRKWILRQYLIKSGWDGNIMDEIQYRLLTEVIRFMEICQRQTIDGRISLGTYSRITKLKLRFLNAFIRNTAINQEYADKVLKLLEDDNMIRCSFIKLAGR